MRWVGTLVLLAVALGAAFVVVPALREDRKPEGLTVVVEVVDARGRPVKRARVQARYAPGWQPVDEEGVARLEGVKLRVGEPLTPAALRRAIEAEAPSHAPRRDWRVDAEPTGDDTWRVRVVLDPFGRLRLTVKATELPEVRAWVAADPLLGRVVAEGGIAVARPGQPASWRVFGGVEDLEIRMEGMTGVALRSRRVEAPNTGFTREVVLEAEEAMPVTGQVVLRGDEAPDLAGRIEVFELQDDGREIRQPYDVRVARDGSFRVPFAAPVRYRLVPRLAFVDAEPLEVRGGDVVSLEASSARPWLAATLTTHEANARRATYDVERVDGGEPWRGTWTRLEQGRLLVALPGPGTYHVSARVMGDATRAPLRGDADVQVAASGAHTFDLGMTPVPSGSLRIEVSGGPATVVLLDPPPRRKLTVLPRLSNQAVFPHVPAGPFRALVRWRDERVPISVLEGVVEADEESRHEALTTEGRHVVLDGEGEGVWRDSRDRILTLVPDGGPACELRCRRVAGMPRWETVDRVQAGAYRATVHPLGESGRLEADVALQVAAVPPGDGGADEAAVIEIVVR